MAKATVLKSIVTGIAAAFFTTAVSYAGVFQSFEAEGLDKWSFGANYAITTGETGASNGSYVHFENDGPTSVGAWLRFAFTNSEDGLYDVTVYFKAWYNRAKCLTRIDGNYIGGEMDQYSQNAMQQQPFSLGMVSLTAGSHFISFTVSGNNPDNTTGHYMLTVDKIELNPIALPHLWYKNADVVQLITPTDRVAVGTPTPGSTAALEVSSGDVQITNGRLIIQGWSIEGAPDYVFEKEYKLADLTTVEKFIKENKHLPEVPSADEITEKGLDMTEMNYTLLKKVEELTLYIIEQNKKIEALEKKVDGK